VDRGGGINGGLGLVPCMGFRGRSGGQGSVKLKTMQPSDFSGMIKIAHLDKPPTVL